MAMTELTREKLAKGFAAACLGSGVVVALICWGAAFVLVLDMFGVDVSSSLPAGPGWMEGAIAAGIPCLLLGCWILGLVAFRFKPSGRWRTATLVGVAMPCVALVAIVIIGIVCAALAQV